MLPHLSFSLLWAQAGAQRAMSAPPAWFRNTLFWFYAFGDPELTAGGYFGGLLAFVKIAGLFSLAAWILAWVVAALKDRKAPKLKWLDLAALISLVGCVASVTVGVMQTTRRIPMIGAAGMPLSTLVALPFGVVLLVWVERALWLTIGRIGKAADLLLLGAMHMALVLGLVIGFFMIRVSGEQAGNWQLALVVGTRLAMTYMGFVVLARVLGILAIEVVSLRARRLYAIAKLSVIEANRRMWAPWVVLTVFAVILAFTHWFLQPPEQRPAEMGRLYIGTLMLLCSLLITVMVTVLAPISLPQDIQNQTIFTVVSKPVRRLELVWGRMIGFMSLVTVLILVFGLISLAYLWRNVSGTIRETEDQAIALQEKDSARSKQLLEQADQLRTRMSARVPIKGSLEFLDSKGNPQLKGVDVGQEFEYRSHIEGATPATAIWSFGEALPDPYDPRLRLNRRIPVESLLVKGTIEEIENRAMLLEFGVDAVNRGQVPVSNESEKARLASVASRASVDVQRLRAESQKLQQQEIDYLQKAKAAEEAGQAEEAETLRNKAAELHSPPFQIEMTFTVYRTTKGRIGEPVFASIEVANPNPRITQATWTNTFPIREYYTNKQWIPASYLVGSNGALTIKVRCISPTQYLGMAESDLYILQDKGNFGLNFMMGLGGIWLQAMVLTAIGVFAGTFLSWPMALLMTIAFYVAGQVAFSFFHDIQMQSITGGGPFESLIRILTHDNLVSELTPTLAVVVAKTLDALTMPVLTRMAYIVPNFQALDVSNLVADGFAVKASVLLDNTLLAIAYALPFSIGGYFILKNREVAA